MRTRKKISEETKLKISQTLKKKYENKEIVANMSGAHSKKSRKKQSKTMSGRKLTIEHKEKISKSLNNSNEFKQSFTQERTNKIRKTNQKKYGVNNVSQDKDIFEKQQKSSYYSKKYKDTNINYRASYELDFLEHFFHKYPDMQNGPSIKYKFQNKERIYFPDFYIPSINLIIECKNSYLARIDKEQIEAKEKATISNGYNYIIIVDKNYETFV